jgi:hypothetical protein
MSTYSTPSTADVKISREEMAAICKRFRIPPYHCRCFLQLANEGEVKSREFSRRLHYWDNYKRAYRAMMVLLS